jgi:Cu(I)/Ag(I) efflux system membrane fusion protein/cobalt-zinc-cadmium efflux system membrane fusion protein
VVKKLPVHSPLTLAVTIAAVALALFAATKLRGDRPVESAAASTAQPAKHWWTCGMHPQVLQDHPGNCPICRMKLVPVKGDQDQSARGERKVAYWWDPMLGPGSITDHPGKSAMGMDLVPVYEDEVQSGSGVRIDPAVVQNMGVVTALVTLGPLTVTVRTVGTLNAPEPGQHDVVLKINGYIQNLAVDTNGMAVSKGQVLFDLYSPDLQVAEEELISAEQGVKSLPSNASESMKTEAHRLVDSAERKLRLWDIDDRDIETIAAAEHAPKTVPFRSPADGHVIDKAIVEGSAVQAGMKLMRIEDHNKLWLDAVVYEDQIEMVAEGQEMQATLDAFPGRTFAGKITFIYPHLDHMARTQNVRATLDNPKHELHPGMYATVNIVTHPVAADTILAPREAIIDTGTKQLAFVVDPNSPGHFEPRAVRIGIVGDDDNAQVLEGLAPGDQVVTSGQFLMDVESRTTEAIQKMRSSTGK